MWCKKIEDKNGRYQDKEGKRYTVVACNHAQDPKGRTNAQLGLTEFKDLESCLNEWKLVKYIEKKEITENGTGTETK